MLVGADLVSSSDTNEFTAVKSALPREVNLYYEPARIFR